MTSSVRPNLQLAESGLLRTALLPLDHLRGLASALEGPTAEPDQLEVALTRDRIRVAEWTAALQLDPNLMNGVALASQDLMNGLRDHPLKLDASRFGKETKSFLKYALRACSRSTPFGMFAGVTPLSTTSQTQLEVGSTLDLGIRFDSDFITFCINEINKDPANRIAFKIGLNSSLYRAGEKFRYAKMVSSKPVRRFDGSTGGGEFTIFNIDADEGTTFLVDQLGRAWWRSEAVLDLIQANFQGSTYAEALDYMLDLMDHQVLVNDLQIDLMSNTRAYGLREKLAEALPSHPIAEMLSQMEALLDWYSPTQPIEELLKQIRKLAPTEFAGRDLIRVDMFRTGQEPTVGPEVLQAVQSVAKVLTSNSQLEDFLQPQKQAFQQRFGDQFVPLSIALDSELGIGETFTGNASAGSDDLLKGVPARSAKGGGATEVGPRGMFLLDKLRDLAAGGPLLLTDQDLATLNRLSEPHRSFERGSAIALGMMDSPEGPRVMLQAGIHGPTAVRTISRFLYHPNGLDQRLKPHFAHVMAGKPGAIFAEVVHVLPGRMANINARPRMTEYVISYMGTTSGDPEKVLSVDDLVVGIREDRFLLRSLKHDCAVVPLLSTAHAYQVDGLPIYQFLSMLQFDGIGGLEWDWNGVERVLFATPRVEYKHIILTPATWRLRAEDWKEVSAASTDAARIQAARAVRKRFNLQRHVVLAEGDNRLPIDFENIVFLDLFLEIVAKKSLISIQEDLWMVGTPSVHGDTGSFAHELVLGIENHTPIPLRPSTRAEFRNNLVFTSNDFIYYKLYCGWSSSDDVLRQVHQHCLLPMQVEFRLRKWFFIRYKDEGGHHIRIRMFGDGIANEVRERIASVLHERLHPHQIYKLQTDTYEQENDRYGGSGLIEGAETIFHADSEFTLSVLHMEREELLDSRIQRWMVGLASLHGLLNDLLPKPSDRLEFLNTACAMMPKETQIAAGKKYRSMQPLIQDILDPGSSNPFLAALRARSDAIQEPIHQIHERFGAKDAFNIFLSHTHMATNRMVKINQTSVEFILYDFMRRHLLTLMKSQPPDPSLVAPTR